MNGYPLTIFWLRILAIVAVEVGLVALCFALLQLWCRTAAWRRTFCQAAMITALVVAFSELSGAGRSFVDGLVRPQRSAWSMISTEGASASENRADRVQIDPVFRSKVFEQVVKNRPRALDLPMTNPALQTAGYERA